jgi:hypothetical protein
MSYNTKAYAEFCEKVRGTNIHEQTLLATDYLNHFNEVVMLLEMLPDMPECFEDVSAWQPKSYQDHFRDSGFSDKDLAIAAYDHAPACYREPFDQTIAQTNDILLQAIARLGEALDGSDETALRQIASQASQRVQKLIERTSSIIHGSQHQLDQSAIDDILD